MKRVVLCTVLLGISALASAGVVYKWTDAQGKTQYGDQPPDGVHAEVVELLGTHSSRASAPVAHSSNSNSSSDPSAPPKSASNRPANPTAPGQIDPQKAVDEDVAQTREKQCADAQEHYKKLIEGRRLYKTGADGEREYLTSDEVDSERVNAKRDVDSICNSPT
jgi:hypothetical protein